ncbi:MAG: agmatinase family protein [Chitinophagales bacterium]|nr:agmatinase family protein [Chitinophagales bacterium]
MKKDKAEKIKSFDASGIGMGNQIFGLPFNEEESEIIILPVPWEVTVSYNAGTAMAPRAIQKASLQVDLFDVDVPDAWKRGIFMKPVNKNILKRSQELRHKAVKYIAFLEDNGFVKDNKTMQKFRNEINNAGQELKSYVKAEMSEVLHQNKLPALLGGDHSIPLGFLEALADFYPEFGILQIDAHCDLRNAYEGFVFSHASIMFNALKIPQIKKLLQVGIRDVAESELQEISSSGGRIKPFFDAQLKRNIMEGKSWKAVCDDIIQELPEQVYVSFDIDGLDPKLCPNTGTPVPGGLDFDQAVYLILQVVRSGRKIIGFDLNEVSPGKDEWDANVGARMLYKLSNLMGLSRNKINEESIVLIHENPRNDELVINLNQNLGIHDER